MIPAADLEAYDMHAVVGQVVDDGQLFEIMPDFAKNIITGEAGAAFQSSSWVCCQEWRLLASQLFSNKC
jgi:hypothetical protein